MSQPEHVLVVGAGLGGLRTVEQLRTAGFQGRISLVGDELHAPYDRPPLSKQVLTGAWAPERATLRSVEGLDELGVRTHLGLRAVALRPGEVELADGASLHADAIVVATGLAARTLPGQPAGVHTLRTLDDALACARRWSGRARCWSSGAASSAPRWRARRARAAWTSPCSRRCGCPRPARSARSWARSPGG